MASINKNLVFSAAVRGFHVYKTCWKPREDELLECVHERENPYDLFSIRVFKPNSPAEIVGHLPMEISRITKFIMDRGAKVTLKISGKHYRRSPLVQGGLEVPCKVKIEMCGSIVNHLLLVRYESLLKELYIEPKDEEIIGTFLSIEPEQIINQEDFFPPGEEPQARPKKKNEQKKKADVKSRDIRDMFKKPRFDSKTETTPQAPIFID